MTVHVASVTKDPDAVIDYKFDWTRWLAETTTTTDTISTSSWTVPSGLTKDSDSNTTTSTTVWLSGGTAGTAYQVANRIVTAGGRTADRTMTVYVQER